MSDPILLWNEVALEANRISHSDGQGEQTGPTLSSRALAIVHLAMHDAYAGATLDPALSRYLSVPAPAGGEDPAAAVAAAAHCTLTHLYRSQSLHFDRVLAGAGTKGSTGEAFGVAVAQAILAERNGDPGAGSILYRPTVDRGRHRPDPDNPAQGFHAPDYGKQSKGFAIRSRWRLAKPPLDDADFRAAVRELRGKGVKPELAGTVPSRFEVRSVDETLIGLFWAYDGAAQIGTPPRLYNQILRKLACRRGNSAADNARLFALANVAMADAGILAWEEKYCHDYWRPVVGIREFDPSLGPGARVAKNNIADSCDPQWLPLGAPNSNRLGKNFTPPFPAYPSGHATFGAAAFQVARLFYNVGGRYRGGKNSDLTADDLAVDLDLVSEELNGVTTDNLGAVRPKHRRRFPGGMWQMIEENARSRIYLGVHWIFDAFAVTEDGEMDLNRLDQHDQPTGGVPLGLMIAEDVYDSYTTPGGWNSSLPPDPRECHVEARRAATYSSQYLR